MVFGWDRGQRARLARQSPMDTLSGAFLQTYSRREFLRYLRNGALALFWLGLAERAQGANRLVEDEMTPEMGRALGKGLEIYRKPSFSAEVIAQYEPDTVLPITGVTIGDQHPAYNRVWYLMDDMGYAHSTAVQPVAMRYNIPMVTAPQNGRLVEVTVPFTDALWNPDRPREIAYRFYFSATFWVTKVVADRAGSLWYAIADDVWDEVYYVHAEHLRPLEPRDLEPISPHIYPEGKRLEVHLSQQIMIAYEDSSPVFMARVSSGARFSSGNYTTPVGTFVTSRKRPSRHMASGDVNFSTTAYDLPGVPWVCYITETGVAFHGTYWHNDYGRPRSHGCLNLAPSAARWVYRWTLPAVPYTQTLVAEDTGTRVDILE